ncbi:ATP-dependent DNA helicase [Salinisphaera orenii MK-B5]|uniref:DNA 3'-5' helicase n=1 Tax=Salinisphaera orenii MK-B5 TaxID=856730 RepID=A0A423PV55_9GAMM|nr:ATP-dependent helicase [Salinisphaera orenii]ROO29478.1 ATP-dependent DNA helicase [Salinisphaera orenii MK-B5]
MTDTAHLEDLNERQRSAVTFGRPDTAAGLTSDPLLVIAGAGTGKTQTLSHRAAHLVLSGVDARRILLLTFSRRAAEEMTRRARGICDAALAARGRRGQAVSLPWAGTFHAIGARLLREYAPALGLSPNFSILDRADAADLIDVCRQHLGLALRTRRFPRKDTCLAIYSQVVNRRAKLAAVLETRFPWCVAHHDALKRLFAHYTERKQHLALLDYDDLLLHWALMMREPGLAAGLAARFDHVLVDEYQDTNLLQAEILRGLAPTGAGLCVVGDDAQAIYGFRAADVDNILGFADQYAGARVVRLERNYRSTQAILDAANTIMADAARRYDKQLASTRGAGLRPRHIIAHDGADEARHVIEQVLARRETGVALKQQAVLFRNAHHANEVEIELVRRDIPYRKYGGLKFLDAAHVKDLLALVRWAANPANQIAVFRALQIVPGVGPASAQRAFERLEADDWSLAKLGRQPAPRQADAEAWCALVDTVAALADGAGGWPATLEPAAEWLKAQLPDRYEAPTTARAGDIDDLVRIAARYRDRDRFLTELTLDPPAATGDHNDDAHLDDDYLVLSTVHSAKGREFDSVYLLHVADGTFPSEYAARSPADLEEERRLLYVAFTRARNVLEVVSPLRYHVTEQRRLGDRHVYGAISRFMTPAVRACFSARDAGTPVDAPVSAAAPASLRAALDVGAAARRLWD